MGLHKEVFRWIFVIYVIREVSGLKIASFFLCHRCYLLLELRLLFKVLLYLIITLAHILRRIFVNYDQALTLVIRAVSSSRDRFVLYLRVFQVNPLI